MGAFGNRFSILVKSGGYARVNAPTRHHLRSSLPPLSICRRTSLSKASRSYLHCSASLKRIEDLRQFPEEPFPRVSFPPNAISCKSFLETFSGISADSSLTGGRQVVLHGRINSIRRAGKRLVFLDIIQDGHKVQILCNLKHLESSGVHEQAFSAHFRRLRRGDHLRAPGLPYRTDSGQISLLLTTLPQLLSPCLADLPGELEDQETRMRQRHVDMLVHPRTMGFIRLKSEVINYVRKFLLSDGHVEVQTPILAENAGGAVARPFVTSATEFSERKISMRIAPELWLKRLIIGGLDRVFEIGQSFRNEGKGIDLSHNPEFMTCEFYKAFVGLEDLMHMTEDMLSGLYSHLLNIQSVRSGAIPLSSIDFKGPYARIDFTEQLQTLMGRELPDLTKADALADLKRLLDELEISVPESSTVPQLLDRLSAHFLEPHCREPTFIINHPECLAPLAKSYRHPNTGHMVSPRAELFVNGQEIINMYEEENCPSQQRRKFEDQLRYGKGNEAAQVDESYLEALESGLPPTGGWGGGIERLCMAVTDNNRISDFLSFGTLRNVVSLSSTSKRS